MNNLPQNQRAFTLVEVMVALALMGLMSAMAYKGISAMLTAQSTIAQASDNTTAMQRALAQWSQDWTSAAGVLMRPGPHFTGNAVRMVRGHSTGVAQVVAWKSGPAGLQRLAWPPAHGPHELSDQWDATWQWIQQSALDTPQIQGQTAWVDAWPMLGDMNLHYHMENAWTNPFNTDTSDGWPDAVRLDLKSPHGRVVLDWRNPNIRSSGKS